MKFKGSNVLNFTNLLLEFSDKFDFTPEEIVVILMINHLKSQSDEIITAEMLVDKTHMTKARIDEILVSLYKKQYLEYDLTGKTVGVKLDNLEKLLYKEFEKSLFQADEMEQNKEEIAAKTAIYEALEDLMQRSLTNLEINRVEDWLSNTTDYAVIINSIKDAKNKKQKNIYSVDQILIRKLREMDSQGNEIKK